MKSFIYKLVQCTWGIMQTFVGLIIFFINIKEEHFFYHGAIVTKWKYGSSVSLGMFIFVTKKRLPASDGIPSEEWADRLLVHEYGHTVQSLFLGPLYLLVIGLPSILWASLPVCSRRRREKKISYYRFYPERWANYCGEKVTKHISMQEAMMD